MIDRVVAPLTARGTFGGPFSRLTRNHVILFTNTDEQRALHTVGHPDRSEAGGPRKRKWQVLVAPEGAIATDGLETGERLGLREPGYGAWSAPQPECEPAALPNMLRKIATFTACKVRIGIVRKSAIVSVAGFMAIAAAILWS